MFKYPNGICFVQSGAVLTKDEKRIVGSIEHLGRIKYINANGIIESEMSASSLVSCNVIANPSDIAIVNEVFGDKLLSIPKQKTDAEIEDEAKLRREREAKMKTDAQKAAKILSDRKIAEDKAQEAERKAAKAETAKKIAAAAKKEAEAVKKTTTTDKKVVVKKTTGSK